MLGLFAPRLPSVHTSSAHLLEGTTMSHETTPSHGAEARPFPLEPTPIHVRDDLVADLQQRLELTRWLVQPHQPHRA
jgi:hypothetical protein